MSVLARRSSALNVIKQTQWKLLKNGNFLRIFSRRLILFIRQRQYFLKCLHKYQLAILFFFLQDLVGVHPQYNFSHLHFTHSQLYQTGSLIFFLIVSYVQETPLIEGRNYSIQMLSVLLKTGCSFVRSPAVALFTTVYS